MSRTKRFKNFYDIAWYVDSVEKIEEKRRRWPRLYDSNVSAEKEHQQQLASFHAGKRTFLLSVPHWHRNLTVHRPERRFNKRELSRCVRQDCWDDHVVDNGYYMPYYW